MIELIQIRNINKDNIFKLLFINTLLVIIGYASARVLDMGAFQIIKVVRTIFLFSGLIYVIKTNGFSTSNIFNFSTIYILLLFILILSFFSENTLNSIYRSSTFILPFLYILYTINHLLRYGALNLLISFSRLMMLIYVLVPISFFLFGGDISNSVIYGEQDDQAFVSNHYGWSSTIYILSAFTVLKYYPLKKSSKYLIIAFLPIAFYILIISANRSGMLALALAFIFFVLKDKHINAWSKIGIFIFPVIIIFFIATQENSVFEFLQHKNEQQLESGQEGRLLVAEDMIVVFNANPVYWFTGVGMFNYKELLDSGGVLKGYHNSYFEILFGAGLILFILFLLFMVVWPIMVFLNVTATYCLLIFPLMLIPFFESDLTAGQFLFFPWFSYMLLLNAKEFHPKLAPFYN